MIEELKPEHFVEASQVYLEGLRNELPPGNSDVKSLIEKLKNVKGYVYLKDSKVVGIITYTFRDSDIVLDFIASILPRQGIGRDLMKKLIEFGKENNLKNITARESTEDAKAMGFYKALGFEKYGEMDEEGLLLNQIKFTL